MPLLNVECIDNAEGLQPLRTEWNELLGDSEADSIFLTYEWISAWLQVAESPRILTFAIRDDGGRLVGLAPFHCQKLRLAGLVSYDFLRMAASLETGAEYQRPFMRRGYESDALQSLTQGLAEHRHRWDAIWAMNLDAWHAGCQQFGEGVAAAGFGLAERPSTFTHVVLPVDREQFWSSRSKSMREAVRRSRKQLEGRDWRFRTCETEADVNEFKQALFDLHAIRWQAQDDSGAFERRPGFKRFVEAFLPVAHQQGWLRFHMLEIDGAPCAVQLGFVYNGAYHVFQEGFDINRQSGLGNVLRAMVLDTCIDEGVTDYDFLGGTSEHKRRWGAEPRQGQDLIVWPKGFKQLIFDLGPIWPTGRFFSAADQTP